jgi:hypothetical protein
MPAAVDGVDDPGLGAAAVRLITWNVDEVDGMSLPSAMLAQLLIGDCSPDIIAFGMQEVRAGTWAEPRGRCPRANRPGQRRPT